MSKRSYSFIVAMDTANGVYMSCVSIMYCSRVQNNALSHLLTHFSIWPNTVQFGRTKFTIHIQWEPLTMCNNVTISNKWLITTIFKINILSSAVEMFVAEIFHYM